MRVLLTATVLTMGCATVGGALEQPRSPMLRDFEGYAIASCLVQSSEPYLRDQGDGWGSVIVQRSKSDLEVLTSLTDAVKVEVAKGGMAVVRDETKPNADKALPVLYCSEIIDAPSVRAAIAQAANRSKSDYGE